MRFGDLYSVTPATRCRNTPIDVPGGCPARHKSSSSPRPSLYGCRFPEFAKSISRFLIHSTGVLRTKSIALRLSFAQGLLRQRFTFQAFSERKKKNLVELGTRTSSRVRRANCFHFARPSVGWLCLLAPLTGARRPRTTNPSNELVGLSRCPTDPKVPGKVTSTQLATPCPCLNVAVNSEPSRAPRN